jgi:hypothetical protein
MRLGELCHLKNGIHRPQEFSDQNRGRQRQQRPIHALPKELLTKWKPITDTTAPNLLLREDTKRERLNERSIQDAAQGHERQRTRAIGFSSHSLRHFLPRIDQGNDTITIKELWDRRDDHDLFAPSAKKRATLCSPLDFFIEIE